MNNTIKLVITAVLLILLATVSNLFFSNIEFGERDVYRFQKTLNKKVDALDNIISFLFKTGDVEPFEKLRRKGFSILVYRNDSLLNWSDNGISFPNIYDSAYFSNRLVFNSNAWYVVKVYKKSIYKAIGFILIKKEFPYENDFLINGYQKSFKLPVDAEIHKEKFRKAFSIYDWDKNFIFGISLNNQLKYSLLNKYLPPFFYFLSFLVFLQLINVYLKKIKQGTRKNWLIIGFGLLFILLRLFQTFIRVPTSLYQLDLFSPVLFANSEFLPSLGDLLLNTILITFIVIKLNRDFFVHERFFSPKLSSKNALPVFCVIIIVGYFIYIYHIFDSLIVNSGISFEAHKITGLSIYSLIGLFIIGLHYISLVLIIDKLLVICRGAVRIEKLIITFSLVLITAIISLYLFGIRIDSYAIIFLFLIFVIFCIIHFQKTVIFSYSFQVILILLFSVFSVYFISKTTEQKERQNMLILAENLATEHDPVAELLLEDISDRIAGDSILENMLFDMNVSYQDISAYLSNNFFTGFWEKYSFHFVDCRPQDSIYFDIPNEDSYPCYEFYMGVINDRGMQLSNSKFYYIDNSNGRINYLGIIPFRRKEKEIKLFIDLESHLVPEEIGYPRLLLDDNFEHISYLKDYSYAKYYRNKLITQSGDFPYSLNRNMYGEYNQDFSFIRFDRNDHLIFNIDNENTIILSKPSVNFFNLLVSFSYIFVFYYILLVTTLLVNNISKFDKKFEFNLKNKIQISIISILLLSLILVGGGTIYFSIEQYQNKNFDNLSEKIQSVYVELDHKLAYENELTPGWSADKYDNLDQLLIKFSDVFYSDINLYAPNGDLLATSRSEIFERELEGTKMNPVAYQKLTIEKSTEFVHRESIGKLSYLSAYVPFINVDNKLLAYLNLPYFTKEDLLKKEITTLAVAIINIYVLLILITIAVTIFISDTITKPLKLLQEKFGQIKLLKQHELIEYRGSDEIGKLVLEYNRMVQELQKSAELLARSEREIAWREMAKQIAHEIKNPLTPMRLTVQHLQRAWNDKKTDYPDIQKRVTQTLIEQIDNLSKIASEFSNFAQMPKAINQKVNLEQKIKNVISLFSNSSKIQINFSKNVKNDIHIFVDNEQLSRIFLNLLKNAIQSIPDKRKGEIDVILEKYGDMAVIKIRDNGKGIPDDVKDKLFMPNFTTKSSGMGLGLAIIKNIIENINGTIDFETKLGAGTTFIVKLPIYKDI